MKLEIAYGTPGKTDFIEDAETMVIYAKDAGGTMIEDIEIIVKGSSPAALARKIVRAFNQAEEIGD